MRSPRTGASLLTHERSEQARIHGGGGGPAQHRKGMGGRAGYIYIGLVTRSKKRFVVFHSIPPIPRSASGVWGLQGSPAHILDDSFFESPTHDTRATRRSCELIFFFFLATAGGSASLGLGRSWPPGLRSASARPLLPHPPPWRLRPTSQSTRRSKCSEGAPSVWPHWSAVSWCALPDRHPGDGAALTVAWQPFGPCATFPRPGRRLDTDRPGGSIFRPTLGRLWPRAKAGGVAR